MLIYHVEYPRNTSFRIETVLKKIPDIIFMNKYLMIRKDFIMIVSKI